jgi:hypothetical protein
VGEVFNEAVSGASVDHSDDANFPYIRDADRKGVKLFVSYAREDEYAADFLYQRLAQAGFTPWMDKHSILPGERWDAATQSGLREADFFVACLSSTSVRKRGYLQREFKFALEKWRELLADDIYIIPIRLDDCEIPQELSAFQWIDLYPSSRRMFDYTNKHAEMLSKERSRKAIFRPEGGWARVMQAITEGIRRRRV